MACHSSHVQHACEICDRAQDASDCFVFSCQHRYHRNCANGLTSKHYSLRKVPCHQCLRVCSNMFKRRFCKNKTCRFNHDAAAVALYVGHAKETPKQMLCIPPSICEHQQRIAEQVAGKANTQNADLVESTSCEEAPMFEGCAKEQWTYCPHVSQVGDLGDLIRVAVHRCGVIPGKQTLGGQALVSQLHDMGIEPEAVPMIFEWPSTDDEFED